MLHELKEINVKMIYCANTWISRSAFGFDVLVSRQRTSVENSNKTEAMILGTRPGLSKLDPVVSLVIGVTSR